MFQRKLLVISIFYIQYFNKLLSTVLHSKDGTSETTRRNLLSLFSHIQGFPCSFFLSEKIILKAY